MCIRDSRGSIPGDPSIDLGFEIAEDLRAPPVPPRVGIPHRLAVLQCQDVGDRKAVGPGQVVVRPVAPARAHDRVARHVVGPVWRRPADRVRVRGPTRVIGRGRQRAWLREMQEVHHPPMVRGRQFPQPAAFFRRGHSAWGGGRNGVYRPGRAWDGGKRKGADEPHQHPGSNGDRNRGKGRLFHQGPRQGLPWRGWTLDGAIPPGPRC